MGLKIERGAFAIGERDEDDNWIIYGEGSIDNITDRYILLGIKRYLTENGMNPHILLNRFETHLWEDLNVLD